MLDVFGKMKKLQIDAYTFVGSMNKGNNYAILFDTESTDDEDWIIYGEYEGENIDEKRAKNGDIQGIYICGDTGRNYSIVNGEVILQKV